MQIQRLKGKKSNFELSLNTPYVNIGNSWASHIWERNGSTYKCRVFLEAKKQPEYKNESIGYWLAALPVQILNFSFEEKEPDNNDEELDILVKTDTIAYQLGLIDEELYQQIYDSYIDEACEEYCLESVLEID